MCFYLISFIFVTILIKNSSERQFQERGNHEKKSAIVVYKNLWTKKEKKTIKNTTIKYSFCNAVFRLAPIRVPEEVDFLRGNMFFSNFIIYQPSSNTLSRLFYYL